MKRIWIDYRVRDIALAAKSIIADVLMTSKGNTSVPISSARSFMGLKAH